MKCPQTDIDWQGYSEAEDVRMKQHLTGCHACRVRASEYDALHALLAALPTVAAPVTAAPAAAPAGELTCTQFHELLEQWREGELDTTKAFLMDDHILWCDPCAAEVERAERLQILLNDMPSLTVPAIVSERIAAAQVPWWERILPPAHAWQRVGWATAAAALLLVTTLSRTPQVANVARVPQQPRPTSATEMRPIVAPVTVQPIAVLPTPEVHPAVTIPTVRMKPATPPSATRTKKSEETNNTVAIVYKNPTGAKPEKLPVKVDKAPVDTAPVNIVVPEPVVVIPTYYDVAKSALEHISAESRYGMSEEDASNVPENISMLPGARPNG